MKLAVVVFAVFCIIFAQAVREEVESQSSNSEDETESSWHCTEYPEYEDRATTCKRVQEWINHHNGPNYQQHRGCEGTEALSIAKSLLKPDDECYLDWATPYHLGGPGALLETHAKSKNVAERLKSKVSTHTKGIAFTRDQFIQRIEQTLMCTIDKIIYCDPKDPPVRTAIYCDFTSECDECNKEDGCKWDGSQEVCVPDCDDCRDTHEAKTEWTHDSDISAEPIINPTVMEPFDPEDCEDILMHGECEHHGACMWVHGDPDEDEHDHCIQAPEDDYDVVPCGVFHAHECSHHSECVWMKDESLHDHGSCVHVDSSLAGSSSGSSGSGSDDE